MPDSSAIDNALMAKLAADTALMALTPDGVFWSVAGASIVTGGVAKRFIKVSLVDESDESIFEGRASEDGLYDVTAVMLSTVAGGNPKAAAARIDVLLELGTLTIPGYALQLLRRRGRIRLTERDDADSTILWFHHGGRYQLMAAPIAA